MFMFSYDFTSVVGQVVSSSPNYDARMDSVPVIASSDVTSEHSEIICVPAIFAASRV
jgi:hypothetical protein